MPKPKVSNAKRSNPTKADLEIENESLKEQIEKLRKELYRARNVPQIARNYRIVTEENKKLKELLKISNIIYDEQT